MNLKVPSSLKQEHEELRQNLDEIVKLSGMTGELASQLSELIYPHFLKEEKYALPPLALLNQLTEGCLTSEMESVLPLISQFKRKLNGMLEEHELIRDGLIRLKIAARSEEHPEVLEFAENLMLHARIDEEVTYPAALLVGEFLESHFKI